MLQPAIIPEFMFQPTFLKFYRSIILGETVKKKTVKINLISLDVLRNCMARCNFYIDCRGAYFVSFELDNLK